MPTTSPVTTTSSLSISSASLSSTSTWTVTQGLPGAVQLSRCVMVTFSVETSLTSLQGERLQ